MTQQLSLFPEEDLSKDDCLSKTCIACGYEKSVDNFGILVRRVGERNTLRTVCKECDSEARTVVADYRKNNPLPQDHCCPLCGRDEKAFHREGRYRTQSPFSVDHNPETLEVRGWICNPCNSSMGLAKHSIDVLKNMIDYLKA